MNRQYLLFLIVCLALAFFWYNLSFDRLYGTTPAHSQEMQNSGKNVGNLQLNLELYAGEIDRYLAGDGREPFRRSSERKKLPPVALSLPPLDPLPALRLPPLPAPAPGLWGTLLYTPEIANKAEAITSEELAAVLNKGTAEPTPGSFAKQLKSHAHDDDIVRMQNGREWRGKIIKETANEILLSVPGPIKSFSLPRDRIAEIRPKVSLEQFVAQEIKKIAADDVATMLKFAAACSELNLNQWAEELYRQAMAKSPTLADGYLAYAGYLLRLGDYDRAYRVYLAARGTGIVSEEIKYLGASLEAYLGLKEKALDTLSGARQAANLLLAAELSFALGRHDQLNRLLEAVAALRTLDSSQQAMICYWKARLALAEGELEKCRQLCEEAKNSQSPQLLNLVGVTRYVQGEYALAQKSLRAAGAAGCNEAWYNLALVYLAQGDNALAVELLKALADKYQLIKTLPTRDPFFAEPALLFAALAYAMCQDNLQQNYTQALSLLEQAAAHLPRYFVVDYLWGEIEERRGEAALATAYDHYRQALTQEFRFSYALAKLSQLALLQNKDGDALYFLAELAKRPATLPAGGLLACDIMRARLALTSDPAQAKKSLVAIVQQSPQAKTAWKMLVWLHNKQDETEKAQSCIRQLLALDSGDTYAQEAQRKISDNSQRLAWEESFNRQDNDNVRRRWSESEGKGMIVAIRGGKAILGGRELQGQTPTTLYRLVEEPKFFSFSAKLDFAQASQADTGMFLATVGPKVELFYFGKTEYGMVAHATGVPGEAIRWELMQQQEKPVLWPSGTHQVTIARSTSTGWALWLDDQLLLDGVPFASKGFQRLQIGFFGVAASGVTWSFSVDDVTVVEKQP